MWMSVKHRRKGMDGGQKMQLQGKKKDMYESEEHLGEESECFIV